MSSQEVLTLSGLRTKLQEIVKKGDLDVDKIRHVMESYAYNEEDWTKYAHFSSSSITRNLVDAGNDNFNLILVCWEGGQRSTIHDHANSHCFMRQLTGASNEIRYAWPTDTTTHTALVQTSIFQLQAAGVSYINDKIGLHRMENASDSTRAMTLHLYSPPIRECSVFAEDTGKRDQCRIRFWTEFGEKTNLQKEQL